MTAVGGSMSTGPYGLLGAGGGRLDQERAAEHDGEDHGVHGAPGAHPRAVDRDVMAGRVAGQPEAGDLAVLGALGGGVEKGACLPVVDIEFFDGGQGLVTGNRASHGEQFEQSQRHEGQVSAEVERVAASKLLDRVGRRGWTCRVGHGRTSRSGVSPCLRLRLYGLTPG
jgi:hypothetical protein